MPTGDVLKLSLFTHTTQRQFINTHYYKVGSITTTDPFDEAAALSDAFNTTLLGLYRGALSDETEFGCIKIESISGAGIPSFIQHYNDLQGTLVGPVLPPNMAVIIRRRGFALAKVRFSLLFLGGVRTTDTNGSFLVPSYVAGPLQALVNVFNDQIIAAAAFNLAEFDPVIPHTQRVYATDVDVTVNVTTNDMTLVSGAAWDVRGFITGGQFSIAAPSRNKGTYTATVTPASLTIVLTDNELELAGSEILSCQQVVVPTDYIPLLSTQAQLAIRQLARRRSSHTGVVA